MKKVLSRNGFFICWYAIYFAITLVRASFNRICQIPRLVHNIVYRDNRAYVRKVSQHAWLEKWNLLVDSNYWMIIVAFVFFSLMTIFKLMYHFGKSFMFLWNNFIKTLLNFLKTEFFIVQEMQLPVIARAPPSAINSAFVESELA